MSTVTLDISVSQLIESIKKMKADERQQILKELYEMEEKHFIEEALKESLEEADNEEIFPHESVVAEMRQKYGL